MRDARQIEAGYAEISQDLADRFWEELNQELDELIQYPERQYFDPSGFRRRNLRRFPVHVLFEIRADLVRVVVIRHHQRDPNYGMRRK
ncbi:type II toxin-antitoxin system RelE/ParE family toxin [Sulfuriroseicoccus oceanibius]|uniref:Type II toxin-antitoxin system RelE/ParE family toxin n=1 Tax=Sulfuriroseicoccus oceanibius TaxID=2707525 RepID=A0A6B3LCF9_9BACT|nr:type II toxin-antitoxin system RelE/ParE family toxin [Sulfuriroseicoccus oceanibius]